MDEQLAASGPLVIPFNPGSLVASKMVKKGFGITGNDIQIGADIIVRATLPDEFKDRYAEYFDNNSGQFAPPHVEALNKQKTKEVVGKIEELLLN